MPKKPSMGRQKIKLAKIEVKNHLQVTFSKRRSGLFKKASELCTLCGVEIAIIVFSPAGKVFSFGHPNVESIIDRFLTRTRPAHNPSPYHLLEAQRNVSVGELNLQLAQILNEVEAEKQRAETINHMSKSRSQSQHWWEGPINKLGLHELEQLRVAMEELKKNVTTKLTEMTNPSLLFAPNHGTGVFDLYESKPNQASMDHSNALGESNFGYFHGFF